MTSTEFTINENASAEWLRGLAADCVGVYAAPADHAAATIAVLRAALNLAGGDASADRLAVLEAENAKLASEGRGGVALLARMIEQRDKAEAERETALLGLVESQDYAKTEYLQREKLEAENALFYSELVKLRGML